MSESKPALKRWAVVIVPVGLVFLLLYASNLDLGLLGSVLGGANWVFFVLALGCVLGSVVCNTLSWQSLLRDQSIRVGFQRVFTLSWLGIFIDALIPGGWSGDIFKAYKLSKDMKVDAAKTTVPMVLKNILELLVTLGALILGIVLLAVNYALEGDVLLSVGSILFLLALPLLVTIGLSLHLGTTKRLIKGVKRVSAFVRRKEYSASERSGFEQKLQGQLEEFHDGILTMRTNPKNLLRPAFFQTLSCVFDVLALFMVFAALGYIVSPDKVVITNTIVVGLQTQGVALFGLAQWVSSSIYTVLGITPLLAAASSLLAGVASFWFKMGVSFVAFQRTMLPLRRSVFSVTHGTFGSTGVGNGDLPMLANAG
ncbi:MAG: lysylphosphatidylglycerol synthase transmembrane domain-containing protein [Candidatus Bathyarchaeia archaeon]